MKLDVSYYFVGGKGWKGRALSMVDGPPRCKNEITSKKNADFFLVKSCCDWKNSSHVLEICLALMGFLQFFWNHKNDCHVVQMLGLLTATAAAFYAILDIDFVWRWHMYYWCLFQVKPSSFSCHVEKIFFW